MSATLEVDLPHLYDRLVKEVLMGRWEAAYQQARAIAAHFERRPAPTLEDHAIYLEALVKELQVLSQIVPDSLAETFRHHLRAWRAYRRVRRCADAGSAELAAARRAYWRIWFW